MHCWRISWIKIDLSLSEHRWAEKYCLRRGIAILRLLCLKFLVVIGNLKFLFALLVKMFFWTTRGRIFSISHWISCLLAVVSELKRLCLIWTFFLRNISTWTVFEIILIAFYVKAVFLIDWRWEWVHPVLPEPVVSGNSELYHGLSSLNLFLRISWLVLENRVLLLDSFLLLNCFCLDWVLRTLIQLISGSRFRWIAAILLFYLDREKFQSSRRNQVFTGKTIFLNKWFLSQSLSSADSTARCLELLRISRNGICPVPPRMKLSSKNQNWLSLLL